MAILYGFWGITTIFLFWGALIRATREWGGKSEQGMAFGVLEGGRGITAALVASLMVVVLAFYMPDDARLATDEQRRIGFQMVVLGYSAVTFVAGVLAWVFIPAPRDEPVARLNPLPNMALVLGRPIIWAQAAVVVCAYCTYKAVDYYSLYLVEVLGKDEVEGARLTSWGAWIRPFAALFAGWVADRFDATRSIGVFFLILAVVYASLSVLMPDSVGHGVIYLNLGVSLFAVFALRGIYFALLQETRTPKHITGAAVGLISVVGYTPEIFFAPIAGRILDTTPGVGGFSNLFMLLAAITTVGVVIATSLAYLKRNNLPTDPVS
jgi:nitrate/nitrite transporter NarK